MARQPCAGQPKPRRAGRRLRVGLPIPGKSQKMDRETPPWCSFPSTNSSHPRATSHCSTTGSADRYTNAASLSSTGPATRWIGTVPAYWERPDSNPNGSSGPIPALRNDLTPTCRGRTPTLTSSPKLNLLTLSAETMMHGDRTLPVIKMLRCQTRQQYTTLPDQDARLEEDATNGASVHSLLQRNASVLPAVCAGHDSVMVKHVSNSGAIAKPTITTYMHIGSTEVLVIDHELLPKRAGDQDAVDAVTRQRDTITRTAADTEVLLPFAQDPDQASTAAPPDDEQDVFGREEALRMDEEIMNFQWFDHVTWDSIKDLRGTTYVEPPPIFRFALQQGQHALLCAVMHHGPPPPASESAWKILVFSSWLLLGRAVINPAGSSCAHFLEARLDLSWSEDWPALSWFVLNATLPQSSAPHANQLNRSCHVSAKLPPLPNEEQQDAPWLQPGTSTSPSHSAHCARDQKLVSSRPGPCRCCANHRVEPLLVPGCRAHPKHTLTNAKTHRAWPPRNAR